MLKGIGASVGVALGSALLVINQRPNIISKPIEDSKQEVLRLREAIEKSKNQLIEIKEISKINIGEDEANIFDAHIMILEDPELIITLEAAIEGEKLNAEYVVDNTINGFIQMFEALDDEYMKERASDIRDVGSRIINNLLAIETFNFSNLDQKVIIIAHDLTPSDTAQMNKEKVAGFITETGGRTSHTAIMARSLEIPAVVGVRDITSRAKNGDYVVIDGNNGQVHINPCLELIKEYEVRKEQHTSYMRSLRKLRDSHTVTKDGKFVELAANIGTVHDLEGVLYNGAEGIGLYRTEFLYMDRNSQPREEEQYQAYKAVLEAMGDKPVIIRTLDIGGDKEIPYLNLPKEQNPFLGYRAMRICLDKTEIFKTQLRALLRSSIHGNLKIMYPMISSLEEVKTANNLLEQVKQELRAEGIEFSSNYEVGIMIEIPSAAIISDILAKEVSFFSIGTNDLIQYTTAVDRMNSKIANLYTPYHPSVLRLIKMVIDNAHRENKWVGMCGEAAGELALVPLFLGLGLDEFSMSPSSILPVRELVSKLTMAQAKEIAYHALTLSTSEEVEKYLKSI